MRVVDPRILELLTFLTRRQAWLSPQEVSREFRLGGEAISARTVQRWFNFLRGHGGFVYYPYPRANRLGLQDVLVRVRGLRNPDVLGILPFASSFAVEVGLGDYEPFVSQGYWVPGHAMAAFRDYWRAAHDLGHVQRVDIFPSRNTHYIYSPFHQTIREDGTADIAETIDNRHFEMLLTAHLKEAFEVKLGDRIAASPLIIPTVVERIWAHCSSRQVWSEIRAKGEKRILAYGRRDLAKAAKKPGAAIQFLQAQWRDLLQHFDEVFLQPRVAFDWTSIKKAMFVSVVLRAGSVDEMVKAAVEISEHAIDTAFRPGLEPDGRCHVSAFIPSDQLMAVLGLVRAYHRGLEPPFVAAQDKKATLELFQPSYCKLDWRLFDPSTLKWGFDAEGYVERLKSLAKPAAL